MKQDEDFDANLAGEEGEAEEIKRSWFRRKIKGITTSTKDKKEPPDGLWTKCQQCRYTCTVTELRENLFVCPKCNYHHRIGSEEYYEILFDDNKNGIWDPGNFAQKKQPEKVYSIAQKLSVRQNFEKDVDIELPK